MFGGLDFRHIISNDDAETLEKHFVSGVITVHSLYEYWTPLFYSVRSKAIKCFDLLIKRGSNINYVDNRGRNALYIASSAGFEYGVCRLIDLGAFIDSNIIVETPLAIRIYYTNNLSHDNITKHLLLAGAKITKVPKHFAIPLWAQEFDATLKKRVQECRKALLALLFACNVSHFRALREMVLCIATQVWRQREGEDAGPRSQWWFF